MLRILAVVALLAVGIGAVGFAVVGTAAPQSAAGQFLTATATRGTVSRSSVATGTISAATTYGLSFGSPASLTTASSTSSSSSAASSGSGGSGGSTWLVSAVNVAVGDSVKSGAVVALADTSALDVQVAIANANLASAKAKLEADQGGPTADVKASAQDSVNQAQLAVTAAEKSQQDTALNNSVSVAQAQQALSNAEAQYTRDKAGPDSTTIASAQDSVNSAQMNVATAQQNLDDLKAQDAITLQQAQAAITAAQQSLADLQAQDQLSLKQSQDAVATAQQNLADLQAQDTLTVNAAQVALANAQAKYGNDYNSDADGTTLAADLAAINVAQDNVNAAQTKVTASEHSSQAQVSTAQSNLASAQAKVASSERTAQAAIDTATANLSTTQTKLAASERSAANQIDTAQAALTSAQHNYDLKTKPASTTIAADEQAIANAQQSLHAAQVKAATSADPAANQVQQAKQSLTAAKHGYDTKVATATDAVIATDQAAVASAENDVTTAKQALSYAKLVAPVDGVVVSVNIVAGATAPSGSAIVIQSNTLQVVANFTETDLPNLATNQGATITIKAVNATVQGAVSAIAPQPASSTTGSVVTYPVTVTISDAAPAVRVGMSAQVSVTTAEAADVISIPSVALRGTAGNYSVTVLDNSGQAQQVPVTVGLIANGAAEIQSGLSEGERVVTGTVSARQGTTTTTPGGAIAIPGVGGGLGGGGFAGGGRAGNGGNVGNGAGGAGTP